MDGPPENQSRRDAEWLNLAVESTQLIDRGGVTRRVLVRGRAFFSVGHFAGSKPVRKAVRLLGIVRDLSDRHLYQRALDESDQRLRWALQQAPIPIMIHSDNGQVVERPRARRRPSSSRMPMFDNQTNWTK